MNTLKNLLLGASDVQGRELRRLAPLRNIECLDLSWNKLKAEDLAQLPQLDHLQALYLSFNDLGDHGLEVLPRLDSLVRLDLTRCVFPPSELRHLRKFPKLRELSLSGAAETQTTIGEFGDDALRHLNGMKNLRILDVSGTAVSEEGIRGLRRNLPQLETVRFNQQRDPNADTKSRPSYDNLATQSQRLDDMILVQALVATTPNALDTAESRGLITRVYVGPRSLQGESFVAVYPFARPNSIPALNLGSGRLASHELVLTPLWKNADGRLHMPRLGNLWLGYTWPAWPLREPFGYTGLPDPDYPRQRRVAEFLEVASSVPKDKRSAFLMEQARRGDDLKASASLALLCPHTATEAPLLELVRNEQIALARRIQIDESLAWGSESPWRLSLRRVELLGKWAVGATSSEEVGCLAYDLAGFGSVTKDSWMSHLEPKRRATALIEAIQSVQRHPKATAAAKATAVFGFGTWSVGVARNESFQALTRLMKDSPDAEVRQQTAFQLSLFAPLAPEEAAAVRELLKGTMNAISRSMLEQALTPPKKP
jgi:hypothetical protein